MNDFSKCVVIGASAGGVDALLRLISKLPPDFPIPVFVVLHIPAYAASNLASILSRKGPLPAVQPLDGDPIEAGKIYVAPPDHHLLIDGKNIAVKRGPKENRFRPSIDALFRSAAYTYGSGAIGVVLSGALDDGTSGLWTIKRLGGQTLVQLPDDAEVESMPRNSMEFVEPDHISSAGDLGIILGSLAKKARPPQTALEADIMALLEKEVAIASDGGAFQKGIMELGQLTPFTCPECHGALVRIPEGKMSRFRCHTGHAYSDSSLLEGVMETTGSMLWQVIRSFEEGVMLLNEMGNHLREAGAPERAEIFFVKARELEKRSKAFHDVTLGHESLSGDNLGQATEVI